MFEIYFLIAEIHQQWLQLSKEIKKYKKCTLHHGPIQILYVSSFYG